MILKPTNITPDNVSMTATEDIEITWESKGDISHYYQVRIYNNTNDTLAYDSGKVQSFKSYHVVSANTLANGNEYKFEVVNYNDRNESATSNLKIFRCYSRPIVNIDTDGYIRNQIATVSATYSQNELVALKAYKFILYDEYDNVLEQSEYIYDGELTHSFEYRLEDDTTYKLECVAICEKDVLGTSGKVSVVADYLKPEFYFDIGTETYMDKPYVKLFWSTVRILGSATGTTNYINNEKVDVTNGSVYFDDGFTLEDDFTIRLWIEGVETDINIFEMIGDNGTMVVKYYDNRVHAYKYMNGFVNHYVSDIVNYGGTGQLYVCIQQIYKNINVISEVIA